MPIREADKRHQELRLLEGRRGLLVKALRDQDWVERLNVNADFKKFLAIIETANEKNLQQREQALEVLGKPLPPDSRSEYNERLISLEATIRSTNTILEWPINYEKGINEAREELPKVEERLKKLKEAVEKNG